MSGAVELLCIGTELLLGNITNGNARWLGEQLALNGLPHHRQEVVGDNRERLIASVRVIVHTDSRVVSSVFYVREAASSYARMGAHLKSKLGSRGKAARALAPGLKQLLAVG